MECIHPEVSVQAVLTAYVDPTTHGDGVELCSTGDYGAASLTTTTDEDAPPPLPERHYCNEDLGLEDSPPPVPVRNYSWSDLEDNDDEALGENSEDDTYTSFTSTPSSDKKKVITGTGSFSKETEHKPGHQVLTEHNPLPQPTLTLAKKPEKEVGGSECPKTPLSSSKSKKEKRLAEKIKRKTDKERQRLLKQEEKKKSKELEALRSGKNLKKERNRYFGAPLDAVAMQEGIPGFVQKCAAIIEEDLCTEGLYRISGGRDDVLYLQETFDGDTTVDLKALEAKVTEFCYVVTSAMKNFFRLLPDPLILNPVATELLKIKDMQPSLQAASTTETLSALPEANKRTLHFMCSHLHRVSENASKNKMNSSNLAIVFWPTFMRPNLKDLEDHNKHLCWQMVMNKMISDPEVVPH